MIISHKYKFIFIKTRKTAGTSIEVFLSKQCGEKDVFTPIVPHVEPHMPRNYRGIWNPVPEILQQNDQSTGHILKQLKKRNRYFNHIDACTIRDRTPKRIWNSYLKFCVERNPWDKSLSHYHMVKDRSGENISFEEYLQGSNFCSDFFQYTDEKGELLVDEVIKYEFLADGLLRVFDKLQIPFEGTLGVKAKSEYRKDRRPYQEVYSDKEKDIIAHIFRREIELHGYSF